jgi:hypothetical protein
MALFFFRRNTNEFRACNRSFYVKYFMIYSLPFSLFESGIILGSIVLCVTCGLSIIACTFIIESLAIQNCFLKEEKNILRRASVLRRSIISSNFKQLKPFLTIVMKTVQSSNQLKSDSEKRKINLKKIDLNRK